MAWNGRCVLKFLVLPNFLSQTLRDKSNICANSNIYPNVLFYKY